MYNPMIVFRQAIENTKPSVATRILKRGGKSYHVSRLLSGKRGSSGFCGLIFCFLFRYHVV